MWPCYSQCTIEHRERVWWTRCRHIMGRRADWQTIDDSSKKQLGRQGGSIHICDGLGDIGR